jgi:alcohol dehydrogenase
MNGFDFAPRTRLVFGAGSLSRLGELARELEFRRSLLVSDPGLVRAGIVGRAAASLQAAGIEVAAFHDFDSNPDAAMIERGVLLARRERVDSLVGLGGGSSMDTAKGVSLLLTNGGRLQDYWGYGKAGKPMLPMIGVPTTAGTGSEAQCYALISDATTHAKMAIGDPKAFFKVALLDPELTLSAPPGVTASAGLDALSHAVESYVTTRRTPLSDLYAREAFRLLEGAYERVLAAPQDIEARSAMQLGAHYAGAAIEASMLGATHACANPLTARYGTEHGVAIALLLPHVVRFNASVAADRYAELLRVAGHHASQDAAESLALRIEALATAGGLPRRLRQAGVAEADFAALADDAATQWTGRFNPRPFDAEAARQLYRLAY